LPNSNLLVIDMTANRIQELRDLVAAYDLNRHAFYEAWRMGTLPVERLANYAAGFDPFVAEVAAGWEAAGRPDYAAEERQHHELWRTFAAALGTAPDGQSAQTRNLAAVAANLFETEPEAIGALYAFEVQQPVTSRSKLDGLQQHYQVDAPAREYFRVHADDWSEARHLEDVIREMPEAEYQRARGACGLMAAALWGGLDGVYYR
jgi:pyrroloquinoline-quinone synthase